MSLNQMILFIIRKQIQQIKNNACYNIFDSESKGGERKINGLGRK